MALAKERKDRKGHGRKPVALLALGADLRHRQMVLGERPPTDPPDKLKAQKARNNPMLFGQ